MTSSTSFSVRLARPVRTRPGPTSTNRRGAELVHRQHHLAPANRLRERVRQLSARVGERLGGDRRDHGRDAAHGTRPRPSARSNSGTAAAIIGEWKAPVTSSSIARSPSALAASIAGRDVRLGARQDDLHRRVVVGDRQRRRVGDLLGVVRPRPRRSPRPSSRRRPPGPTRTSACRAARPGPARHARRRAPAATSAPSSPSEWPAISSATRRADRRPPGETGAEDRGLSEVGALVGPRERVLADHLDRRACEQVRAHARDQLAHLRRLASLTREQDRGRRGASVVISVAGRPD